MAWDTTAPASLSAAWVGNLRAGAQFGAAGEGSVSALAGPAADPPVRQ